MAQRAVPTRLPRWREAKRYLFLVAGSLLAAAGLELFLVPNQIVDGGVVGIAIMAAALTGIPLGIYTFLFNLPFLYFGYKHIGQTFAISTLGAVALLSAFISLLNGREVMTRDPLLAAVFGGVVLGMGVGIVIRNGGSLDGTESVAILLSRRWGFSVGEVVMFFNLFILGTAGLVFSWDRAMYSLLAYFVAFKTIDITMQGLDESRSVTIITGEPQEMADAIIGRLGRSVTQWDGKGGFSGAPKGVLVCVVTRLEVAKLKSIVMEVDPGAFVAIQHIHEVLGGRFERA